MAIYKAPVSAASDAHGASLHNNQNNISYESINKQKYIYTKMWKVTSYISILQYKFNQMLPGSNTSSSFSKK